MGGGAPFKAVAKEPIQVIGEYKTMIAKQADTLYILGLAMIAVSSYSLEGIYSNSRRSYATTAFIRAVYAIGAAALFSRVPGQTFVSSSE